MVLLKVLIRNFRHAGMSAFIWGLIWCASFFGGTVWIENIYKGQGDESVLLTVSGIALTITVISGQLAKLVSYVFGCDTDFKHIFMRGSVGSDDPQIYRLVLSSILLVAAGYLLIGKLSAAAVAHHIISSGFVEYSISFWAIILCILGAQVVFSWPDPEGKYARIRRNGG